MRIAIVFYAAKDGRYLGLRASHFESTILEYHHGQSSPHIMLGTGSCRRSKTLDKETSTLNTLVLKNTMMNIP
jgi:hypothetical protein